MRSLHFNPKLLQNAIPLLAALIAALIAHTAAGETPLLPPGYSAPLPTGATNISSGPLAQPATSVKPNMLLIMDDSGSMARQFTPDYVSSNSNAGTVANCMNSRDNANPPTATPQDCYAGDPPAMSPDFNTQYYNPEIRYFPAVNYDGTSRGDMTAAATSNWTAVPTDNVSTASDNSGRKRLHTGSLSSTTADGTDWESGTSQGVVSTFNLTSEFPDRVWCNSTGASATDTAACKTNSSYSYPDDVFGFGRDGSGNRKYKLGTPYYYRIVPTEFCADIALTNCVAATAPTVVGGVTYNIPAPVRFCNSTALTTCQANRNATFRFPKFLGTVNPATPPAPGNRARGILLLSTGDAGAPTINQITVTRPDSTVVNLFGSALTTVATNSAANRLTAAQAIRDRINLNAGGHGYTASIGTHLTSGANTTQILIDAPTANVADNGSVIAVDAPALTPTTPAALTFSVGGANNSADRLNSLQLGPSGGPAENLIASSITCGSGCNNNSMATLIRNAVNALTGTHGYVASGSGSNVTITAPAGTGSERNGWVLVFSHSGLNNVSASLGGGFAPGDLAHTTSNFTGGVNPVAAVAWSRQNVGTFVRTDIVSGQTYPKFPARTDCSGATTCSYAEEMTNFANWFAYYRTRMMMAKTSIGRAFLTLGSDFRIGYMTINFSTSRYVAVNDFTTTPGGQKQTWFNRLYATSPSGSTPLRGALARAGRYYGNQNPGGNMGASPILLACQPSYTILTTDGYWNDSSSVAVQMNGSTLVGDQDGVNSGYSTQAIGAFDALGASNTLADVAMYYYKTDLRPDLANQVPATQKDNASHQRMVTFTVGLGLAGTLQYDPNYETQTSGDFFDIKQGTKSWPVPTASAETTLDDLWHAAVNGRGTFFSAQDPVALANGIAETLNAVQARVGAGAAAATSNLQPVAGDNFAFTAQYETVSWTGDLRARTIDLSSGTVSSRELWSAQALLDQRAHTTRKIFIFDPADTVTGATVTVNGVSRTQNANKLRSFCWTDAPIGAYPTCDDGGLLTAAEMSAHFNPMGGPNGALLQSIPWPTDGSLRHLVATSATLVDFLRGDVANELSSVGATGLTDLYRNRTHVLGDIVNAQPAYVKAPPFSYTDPFYSTYKSNNTNRIGTVFAAANDGMLHAFETDPDNNPYFQTAGIGTLTTSDDTFAGTLNTSPINGEGSERWAYIPSMVFPTLKRLAEANYATQHRYLTDGSPVVGDVCFGHTTSAPCASASNWKTILVAGLNAGGRGYYALDITDPANPKGLWELKGGTGTTCLTTVQANSGTFGEDCNIGLSFGNPIIVKRPSDGRWVVLLTSGHNNISPGDGKGYLYVVDAQSGLILQRMGTGVGCDGVSTTAPCTAGNVDPSGLSRINAWVNNATENNTALSVYGGDLKGNLWRFQLEDTPEVPANTVTRITTLVNASNVAQPITTRPELTLIANSRIVYVATGKLLGDPDRDNTDRQSVYAIKDPMSTASSPVYSAIRGVTGFVQQTLSLIASETDRRTTTNNSVNLLTDKGWYVDLPDGGGSNPSERVTVDPVLQLGTLVVPSNLPSDDDCVAGGTGWVNFMDARTGSYIPGSTDNMSGSRIGASLIVGVNVVQLPGGTVKTIVTTADNQQLTQNTPVAPTTTQGRRVSWRELFVD
jgi:type IV pilus assembly protein PilY1